MIPDVKGDPQNYGSIAYVGWQDEEESLYGIREGYKNAADDLVNLALDKGNVNDIKILDTYIYPICFLYRHSIEVSLKLIYWRCYHRLPTIHTLSQLYGSVKSDILNLFEKTDFLEQVKSYKKNFIKYDVASVNLDELEHFIDVINEDDPQSDRYRYLLNKGGKLYSKSSDFIDYNKLSDFYSDVYEKLDFIYFVTDQYLSS